MKELQELLDSWFLEEHIFAIQPLRVFAARTNSPKMVMSVNIVLYMNKQILINPTNMHFQSITTSPGTMFSP